MRKQRQDQDPVPLVELLEAAAVDTPGALVDALAERGDAVVVDPLGRLAVHPAVAERLRTEQAEREQIRQAEFERAETERLRHLEALAEREEALRLEQARELAIRERQRRIEVAAGIPLWQLEQEIRRSRTREPNTFMRVDQREAENDRPVSIAVAEAFVRDRYGIEALEGGKR